MAHQEEAVKEFVLDGSNRSVQDIVSKLKFISKFEQTQWMDVTKLQLYEKNWYNRVYRTIFTRAECRDATLEFVRVVFAEAFDLAAKHNSSVAPFRRSIAKMIVEALKEAKNGVENLKIAYEDDKMFVSRLDTLTTILDHKIKELDAIPKPEKLLTNIIIAPQPSRPKVASLPQGDEQQNEEVRSDSRSGKLLQNLSTEY